MRYSLIARRCRHVGVVSLLAASPVISSAQKAQSDPGYSLQQVVTLLNASVASRRILQLARARCLAFSLDQTARARLRASGASTALLRDLSQTCMRSAAADTVVTPPEIAKALDTVRLGVASIPDGAFAYIGDRALGVTPLTALVTPQDRVMLKARFQGNEQSVTTDFSAGTSLQVLFRFKVDTAAWPRVRSAREIAEDLQILRTWQPVATPPAKPTEPGTGILSHFVTFGVLGTAAGFGVSAIPPANCVRRVKLDQDGYVDGNYFTKGSRVDLGRGPRCTGIVTGSVALSSAIVAGVVQAVKKVRRHDEYRVTLRTYETQLTTWTERQRDLKISSDPGVRAVLAKERSMLSEVQRSNSQIRRQNAAVGPPTVVTEPARRP